MLRKLIYLAALAALVAVPTLVPAEASGGEPRLLPAGVRSPGLTAKPPNRASTDGAQGPDPDPAPALWKAMAGEHRLRGRAHALLITRSVAPDSPQP